MGRDRRREPLATNPAHRRRPRGAAPASPRRTQLASLLRETRRQARELALLHEVRTAISREREPAAIYRTVVDSLATIFGYAYAAFATVEVDHFYTQHQTGAPVDSSTFPLDRGIAGRVLRTGAPALVPDVRRDPDHLPTVPTTVSAICVPVRTGREITGVLSVESAAPVPLEECDLRIVTAVADFVGLAIVRAMSDEERALLARVEAARAEEVAAERRFRTLIEHLPAVTYTNIGDGTGTVTYMSPRCEALLGYAPQRWLEDPSFWASLIHPDDLPEVRRVYRQALATGMAGAIAYRMRTADDRLIWVHDEAVPIRDARGEIAYWQGCFIDITDRTEAEARLADAELRYRTLVEHLPAVTYIESPTGDAVHYASPQIEEWFGYPVECYTRDSTFWWTVVHPDDRERVMAANEHAGRTGQPFGQTYRMVAADGRVLWVADRTIPILDPATGQIRQWQGLTFDVTDQKEAEQALAAAERRYRTLVEQLPGMVYALDGSKPGPPTYVSPQSEDLFGYPRSAWLDNPDFWASVIHTEERNEVLRAFREAIVAGRPVGCTYRIVAADGRLVWVEDFITPARDEEGRIVGWQGFVQDITERTESEQRLREAEERFRVLVERLPALTYIERLDPDGHRRQTTYVSPQLRTMLGYDPEVWLAMPGMWGRITHPDDRARVVASYERARAEGTPFREVYRVRASDGRTIWLHDEALAVPGRDGQPRQWLGVALDVTAQREAEARVGEAEAKYRFIVEQLPAATWIWPVAARAEHHRYVSPQYLSLLGLSPDEVAPAGNLLCDFVDPADAARVTAAFDPGRVAAEMSEPVRLEYRLRRDDGRTIWVRTDMRLIRDEEGRPLFWQGVTLDITDRKQAEERLLAAEARFRTLVEQSPAAVYTMETGFDAPYIYMSPQIETMLGYPIRAWLESPTLWAETLHPDDRERVVAEARRTEVTGDDFDVEYRHITRDGGVAWIRDQATLIRDGDGRPLYWQGVKSDITERRRADEERLRLAQSEAARAEADAARRRLHDLVAGLDAIVWEADPSGPGFTFVSQRAVPLLGYPIARWLEDPGFLRTLVHPDDQEKAIAVRRDAVASGRSRQAEYRARTADGREVWLRDIVAATDVGAGGPLRGLMVDVTDRRRAEEALERERDLLQTLMDNTPEMIWFKDISGRFTRINRAKARWLGVADPAQAVGKTDADYFSPEIAAEFAANERRLIDERRPLDNLLERVSRPGEPDRWFLTSQAPVADRLGRIVGIVGSSRDITERRAVEEELLRAKEAAEAANRAKTVFLSRMSHELRTPLNAILGFAQVLRGEELAEEQNDSVEQILRAGRHLLALINEVLDLARIESGALRLSLEPVCLAEVVAESIDLIAPLADRFDHLVAVEPPDGEVHVLADRQRLKQILLNLLGNAIKYTPPGGRVTLVCRSLPDGDVRIEVRDTGPGIAPEQLSLLFDPFERLGAERSGVEGTGLGLALSQRLAEAMGRTIAVESAVEQGSVFWIDLPRTEAPVVDEASLPAAAAVPAPAAAATVLYVEDNGSNVRLVERFLARRPGLRVITATRGGEALALARAWRPDLVLLDLHLPDLPGEAVLAGLRADPVTAALPVIVVSADAGPERIDALLAGGAAAYLTKPLDVDRFLAIVDDALRARGEGDGE